MIDRRPTSLDEALDMQRDRIEHSFHQGWVPKGAGKPRTLAAQEYEEARAIVLHGGWTGLDYVLVQAVRDGAEPGDSIPPREPQPFIVGVHDTEVHIIGEGDDRRVAILFSYEAFPETRFGHVFEPMWGNGPQAWPRYDDIWLMDKIHSGALHEMMDDAPAPDDYGIVWTTWGDER